MVYIITLPSKTISCFTEYSQRQSLDTAKISTNGLALASSDAPAFLDAYFDFLTNAIRFVRPAVYTALELGIKTPENTLEHTLTAANDEFTATFRAVFPGTNENAVYQAGRAIHRAIVSALFDSGWSI